MESDRQLVVTTLFWHPDGTSQKFGFVFPADIPAGEIRPAIESLIESWNETVGNKRTVSYNILSMETEEVKSEPEPEPKETSRCILSLSRADIEAVGGNPDLLDEVADYMTDADGLMSVFWDHLRMALMEISHEEDEEG